MNKLAQRQLSINGQTVSIGLIGNIGYISICDNNLYLDGDSRQDRKEAGFDTHMIPVMTREQLKDLKIAIDEVLKNSK